MKVKPLYIATIILFSFSCQKEISDIAGCMDSSAQNYNEDANSDNGSCIYGSINNFSISFNQTVNGSPLIIDDMSYTNQNNQNYSIQTLKYLLSSIKLHTENGFTILLKEVHFIDISIDSTLVLNIPEIQDRNYSEISFIMGLDSLNNKTNQYINEGFFPSFAWPEFLGGGYHYMQLEGDFNTVFNGYATHTGATNGNDYSFKKTFPITINESGNISINMETTNWYQNPETFNFTSDGIMGNSNSQIVLQSNGIENVFSVN